MSNYKLTRNIIQAIDNNTYATTVGELKTAIANVKTIYVNSETLGGIALKVNWQDVVRWTKDRPDDEELASPAWILDDGSVSI